MRILNIIILRNYDELNNQQDFKKGNILKQLHSNKQLIHVKITSFKQICYCIFFKYILVKYTFIFVKNASCIL